MHLQNIRSLEILRDNLLKHMSMIHLCATTPVMNMETGEITHKWADEMAKESYEHSVKLLKYYNEEIYKEINSLNESKPGR